MLDDKVHQDDDERADDEGVGDGTGTSQTQRYEDRFSLRGLFKVDIAQEDASNTLEAITGPTTSIIGTVMTPSRLVSLHEEENQAQKEDIYR